MTDLPDEQNYSFTPPRWKVALILCLVALALGSLVFFITCSETLETWAAGETDLWGDFRYDPPHDTNSKRLAASDLERVHRRLLPAWGIALGSMLSRAPAEMQRLRASIKDPNLLDLARELDRLASEDPARHSKRIFYLLRAWNTYLDRNGQPWHVDGGVRLSPRAFLYLKVYRVVADMRVKVAGEPMRARLLRRVDNTNVVELYLGSASQHQDGAMVVVDRISEFAQNQLWPLLATPGKEAAPLSRFGPRVRAEARRELPPAAVTLLTRLAPARAALVHGMREINAQARCGSRFRVLAIPHRGLSERARATLWRVALRDAGSRCPAITAEGVQAMVAASDRLAAAPGLDAAVGALTAWVARGVTVHESRHVADDARVNLETSAPACEACPNDMDRATRAELSAYLASFAAREVGYLNLMQACSAVAKSSGGANHNAIVAAARALGAACAGAGPPTDLYARAAALERKYFGRSDAIVLPADFPATLKVAGL